MLGILWKLRELMMRMYVARHKEW